MSESSPLFAAAGGPAASLCVWLSDLIADRRAPALGDDLPETGSGGDDSEAFDAEPAGRDDPGFVLDLDDAA